MAAQSDGKSSLEAAKASGDVATLLRALLRGENGGLAYGEQPKGLLKFHRYANGEVRTPLEEHLIEAAQYAAVNGTRCAGHGAAVAAHERANQTQRQAKRRCTLRSRRRTKRALRSAWPRCVRASRRRRA